LSNTPFRNDAVNLFKLLTTEIISRRDQRRRLAALFGDPFQLSPPQDEAVAANELRHSLEDMISQLLADCQTSAAEKRVLEHATSEIFAAWRGVCVLPAASSTNLSISWTGPAKLLNHIEQLHSNDDDGKALILLTEHARDISASIAAKETLDKALELATAFSRALHHLDDRLAPSALRFDKRNPTLLPFCLPSCLIEALFGDKSGNESTFSLAWPDVRDHLVHDINNGYQPGWTTWLGWKSHFLRFRSHLNTESNNRKGLHTAAFLDLGGFGSSDLEFCKALDGQYKDLAGRTPAHYAAVSGNMRLCQHLPSSWYQIRDSKGRLPFFYACMNGHLDLVRYLVEKYSELSELSAGRSWHLGDNSGLSPLMIASSNAHTATVALLLRQHETRLDLVDSSHETALFHAVRSRNSEVVEAFLSSNYTESNMPARVLNWQNKQGQTALALAAMNASTAIVEILLRSPGIRPDLQDSDGCTPLDHVRRLGPFGSDKIKELLLQKSRQPLQPWLQSNSIGLPCLMEHYGVSAAQKSVNGSELSVS